jgi:putative FmdB family regulatory protein
MPTYEYRCTKCGEHLEVYQSFSEEPLKKHAGCGGKLNKVLGSVGIVFKGSGFYRTDNRGGSKSASKEAASSESSSGSSSDSKDAKDSKGSKDKKSESGSGSGSSKTTEAKTA